MRQASLTVLRGPVVDEVHQQLNSWIYQVFIPYVGIGCISLSIELAVLWITMICNASSCFRESKYSLSPINKQRFICIFRALESGDLNAQFFAGHQSVQGSRTCGG